MKRMSVYLIQTFIFNYNTTILSQITTYGRTKFLQFLLLDLSFIHNMDISTQTMIAMTKITEEIILGDPTFFPIKPLNYERFLVISIGTGAAKNEQKYSAPVVAKWSALDWLFGGGSAPLIDCFSQASGDMVDIMPAFSLRQSRVSKIICAYRFVSTSTDGVIRVQHDFQLCIFLKLN